MLMTSAEFDHMRLRHALRKQEQSSEEDGQRLDERKTTHGALLNHITDLDQQVKSSSGSTARSTTVLIVNPCTMIEKITIP